MGSFLAPGWGHLRLSHRSPSPGFSDNSVRLHFPSWEIVRRRWKFGGVC